MRFLAPLFLLCLLPACVLTSTTAKFSADEGATPIAADVQFDAYTLEGADWKKEEAPLSFKRDGAVYLMSDGKNMASVIFVQLRADWYAAQYREGEGPYYYGFIKTAGSEIEVSPLPCDRLKPLASTLPEVKFSGDDCAVEEVKDAKAFFAGLLDKLPEPRMKLVPRQ